MTQTQTLDLMDLEQRFIDGLEDQTGPDRKTATMGLWAGHAEQFQLPDHPLLDQFETFARRFPPEMVEPSVKETPEGRCPVRCNLYYPDTNRRTETFLKIMGFLRKVEQNHPEMHLDFSVFATLVERGFRLDHCSGMGLGLDFRDTMARSRWKLYFLLKEEAGEAAQIFNRMDPVYDSFHADRTRLVALDLGFQGQTRAKYYLIFPQTDYPLMRERYDLGPKTMAVAARATHCLVSPHPEPVFHMQLPGPAARAALAHPMADRLSERYPYLLSFLPREMEAENLRHFNLYYMVGPLLD